MARGDDVYEPPLKDAMLSSLAPILSRRITVQTVAQAVASMSRGKRGDRFASRIYQATRVSPMLRAAVADAFPFTFCAEPDCIGPMNHDGPCMPGLLKDGEVAL